MANWREAVPGYNPPPPVDVLRQYAKESTPKATQEQGVAVSSADRSMGYLDFPHELYDRKTLYVVDKMMLDEAVGTFIDMKKSAALSTSWTVEPGVADDPNSVEQAEFITHILERLGGTLQESLFDMCSAVEYGYSATNRPWEFLADGPFAGKIGIKALKTKSPHSVRFDTDEFLNILPDGIVFTDNDGNEDNLPLDQFVVYTYRKRFSDPYGYGDCLRAFDRWNSKRWMTKMWDIYGERYAMGTLVAQFKSGKERPSAQEHNVVAKFGNDIQARSFIKLSDGWTRLDLLEASGKGSEFFQDSINHKNMAIARAMFFPDQIGFSDTSTGSFAKAQTHFQVFLWPLERLRGDLEETVVGEQIIRPSIEMNYGPQDKYPKFKFAPLTDAQVQNWLTNVFTAIEKGALKPDLEIENAVRQKLEIAEKEKEEEETAGGSPPLGSDGAEGKDPQADGGGFPDNNDMAAHQLKPAKKCRGLLPCEQKVDVDGIVSTVNDLQEQLVDIWSDHLRTERKSMIQFLRKKKIISNKDRTAANALKLSRSLEMRKSLQRFTASATLFGALSAQQEIARAKKEEFSFSAQDDFQIDLAKLPLDEIDEFFQGKGLVLTPAIREAARQARAEAFFITDVQNEQILSKAKQIIFQGIRRGDQNWTEGQLRTLFEGYLKTGEIKAGALGTTHRIETIARTQFTTAFNQGRKMYFEDPDVDDFVAAYEWSSVIDDATTDYCNEMDGRILKKDELNSIGWPPAHFNCRSMVVPVTEGESFTFDEVPKNVSRGTGFALWRELEAVNA